MDSKNPMNLQKIKSKSCKKSIKGVIDQGFFEIVINVTKQVGFFYF